MIMLVELEHARLALRRERLAVVNVKQILPSPGKTGVAGPNHSRRSHSQRFVSHKHWVSFGATP